MAASQSHKTDKPRVTGLRKEVEQLTAPFPALLAEAERVAAVVAQGVHGRRRPGQGESFWQYRTYQPSDPAHHIDWRRSARSDQIFVRENEWEAAHTVYFWRDGSPGMNWRSHKKTPTKQDRASVLCMALASLLMRAGERTALIGESQYPRSGRTGYEQVSHQLALSKGHSDYLSASIPAHARLVIASDFLEGAGIWQARLATLAARPASGILLHIIDPAEREFPYSGRVEMRLPGESSLSPLVIGRAERTRDAYKQKFETHLDDLRQIARHLNWPLIVHETDSPATPALSALYAALSGDVL